MNRNSLDCTTGWACMKIVDGWISNMSHLRCDFHIFTHELIISIWVLEDIAFAQVPSLDSSLSIPLLPLQTFFWLLWFSWFGIFQTTKMTKYRTKQHLSRRKSSLLDLPCIPLSQESPQRWIAGSTLDVGVERGWYPFWNLKVPLNRKPNWSKLVGVNYDVTSPLRCWILPKRHVW